MQIKNKDIFLRYSLPCAGTLIRRGMVSGNTIKKLTEDVINGNEIKEDPQKIFLVASSECKLLAIKSGKKEIDSGIIRRYFLEEHDTAVNRRFREMGDFDPERCRVYPGKVIQAGDSIKVLTPKGERAFKNIYKIKLKKGDYVTVHFNTVVEKITKERAKDLWGRKKEYAMKFRGFE